MIFLTKLFKPEHGENRMRNEGDVLSARTYFFTGKNNNLRFLLGERYRWMNRFISAGDCGIEVGCGTGVAKEFIEGTLLLTDFADYPWLDVPNVDALSTPFKDGEFDFVIASNMIHHVARPKKFFQEMQRILKPGGRLLIQDVNASFFMRLALHAMKHEGYDFSAPVFNESVICTDHDDLWSANCAIVNLLFDDLSNFERQIDYFKVVEADHSEFLMFLNSGGVVAKTFFIPLPRLVLRLVKWLDSLLVKSLPSIFAMQRQIVLEKRI